MPSFYPFRTVTCPEKAAGHPYLLHGILAVSALHLQSTTRATQAPKRLHYAEKATTHQQLALQSYIPRLKSIDEESCHAIFAFSAALSGLAFGFLCTPGYDESVHPDEYIGKMLGIFDLLLGAVAVAKEVNVLIKQKELPPLLYPNKTILHREDSLIHAEMKDALERLSPGIRLAHEIECRKGHPYAHQDLSVIYDSAIPELRNAFRCLGKTEPELIQGVIGWSAFVDKTYITTLRQRHPAALVVLAYYGVALHALDYTWWLHGIGLEVVKSVAAVLAMMGAQEWQHLLQWPLQRVGISSCDKAETSTMCLSGADNIDSTSLARIRVV